MFINYCRLGINFFDPGSAAHGFHVLEYPGALKNSTVLAKEKRRVDTSISVVQSHQTPPHLDSP